MNESTGRGARPDPWRTRTGVAVAAFAVAHGLPVTGWVRADEGVAGVTWLHDTVVVKVHPPATGRSELACQMQVCDAARSSDVPLCRGGIGGRAGPFDVNGWIVTAWERLDPQPATASGLGDALAALHASSAARKRAEELQLPTARHVRAESRWRPFWNLVTPAEEAVLRPWVEWASRAAHALIDGTVVHGDVNPGNALGGDAAMLIDLDTIGVAWPASDIVGARATLAPADWAAFAEAYGALPEPEALDVTALLMRIANRALYDVRQRHRSGNTSDPHVRSHLELFASTVMPSSL